MEREQPLKKVACMKQYFQQNPTLKPFKWKSLSRTLCDFVYNTVKGGYNIFFPVDKTLFKVALMFWSVNDPNKLTVTYSMLCLDWCCFKLYITYLVPLSMALDNAPVCLFRWKFRSKLWRWRNVLFATERIDPWATLANTAFLNSLNREALVRAAPSKNQVCMLLLVSFAVIISVVTQRLSPTGKKRCVTSIKGLYTLFQKGRHCGVLLFSFILPLVALT